MKSSGVRSVCSPALLAGIPIFRFVFRFGVPLFRRPVVAGPLDLQCSVELAHRRATSVDSDVETVCLLRLAGFR
jgi:hypothetical protein